MGSELEQFLTPYSPIVQALALKLRALIREIMPETIEQLDLPATPDLDPALQRLIEPSQ